MARLPASDSSGDGGSDGSGLTEEQRRIEEEIDRINEQTSETESQNGSGTSQKPARMIPGEGDTLAGDTSEDSTGGSTGGGSAGGKPARMIPGEGERAAPEQEIPNPGGRGGGRTRDQTAVTSSLSTTPSAENVRDQITGETARRLREQAAAQNPGVEPEDITIDRIREDGRVEFGVTPEGQRDLQRQYERRNPYDTLGREKMLAEGADAAQDAREQAAADRVDESLEQSVGSAKADLLGLTNPELREEVQAQTELAPGVDYNLEFGSGSVTAELTNQGVQDYRDLFSAQQAVQLAAAEREAESAEFTVALPGALGGDITLQGRVRDVEPEIGDDGSVTFQTQERRVFGEEIDLPFGFDEMSADAAGALMDFGRTAGNFTAGLATFGDSQRRPSGPEGTQIFSDEAYALARERTADGDVGIEDTFGLVTAAGETAREQDDPVADAVFGATQAPFALGGLVIGAPAAATELAEVGSAAIENPGDVAAAIPGALAGTGAATAGYVAENPIEFGAGAAASLPASAAIFRGAARIGPRTSTAARFAIQPGEELLGRGGFAATRALRGESTAQRFFPNQEPLFFSEEAAFRGLERFESGVGARTSTARNIFTGEQSLPPTFRQQDIIDRFRPEGGTGEFTAEGEAAGVGFAGVGGELGTGGTGSLFDIETVSARAATPPRPSFETQPAETAGTGTSGGELPLFGEIQAAGGVRPFIRGEDLPPAIRPSQLETFLEEERAQAQLARQQQTELDEPQTEFTDFNVFEDTLAARQQNFGAFEGEQDPFGRSAFEERIRAAQAQEARVETEQDTGRGVFSFETAIPGTDAFQGVGLGQLNQSLFGFDVDVDVAADTRAPQDVALDSMQDVRVTQEQEQEQRQTSAFEVFGFTEQRQESEFETEFETESENEFEFEFFGQGEEPSVGGLFGFQPQAASGETFQNPLAGGAEFLFGGSLDEIFGGMNGQ